MKRGRKGELEREEGSCAYPRPSTSLPSSPPFLTTSLSHLSFPSVFLALAPKVSRLRKFITMIQLQRFCGLHKPLTVSDRQKLVDQCKMYYWEGLKLGRDLTPTVRQHSDFFAILATHLKMELFQETGE